MGTKVFISVPWFTPAYKAGGPIRSVLNMVENLSEEFEFFIFTSNEDLGGASITAKLDRWTMFSKCCLVYYSSNVKRSERLTNEIERIKPDIIYIVGMFSWHFTVVPLLFGTAPKKILSPRGMLLEEALSEMKFKKSIFLALSKIFIPRKNLSFHATSAAEEKSIWKVFGRKWNVYRVENFPSVMETGKLPYKQKGSITLISVGIISPMKNILTVLEALSALTFNIEYNIYGAIKDMVYWQRCLSAIRKLSANIKVLYHGDINANEVNYALLKNHVFILPSRSENYGHAIIEALGAGLPVITSFSTPWNFLEENFAGVNVVPNASEISKAISRFAEMDDGELSTWSKNANVCYHKNIDVAKIKADYQNMFSALSSE